MKLITIYAFVFIAAFTTSCAKKKGKTAFGPDTPKWQASKQLSYACLDADKRSDRLLFSEEGIKYGEECIKETPDDPACYYFHAINTGLYYQTKIVGYQKGIKSMIEDIQMVIRLNPEYDHGGAYRMLAMIYTELPQSSLRTDSVIRDLEKALDYANKAIKIMPDYPENYLVLSKTYIKRDDFKKAADALNTALSLFPKWKRHIDYPYWKKDASELKKKIRKHIKGLQLSEEI